MEKKPIVTEDVEFVMGFIISDINIHKKDPFTKIRIFILTMNLHDYCVCMWKR